MQCVYSFEYFQKASLMVNFWVETCSCLKHIKNVVLNSYLLIPFLMFDCFFVCKISDLHIQKPECHIEVLVSLKLLLFLAGTAAVAESGTICTTDFIVIPNPYQNAMSLNTDRFCGNALLPTRSKYSIHLSIYSEAAVAVW